MTTIFFQGLFLGASLIIAIGIQNAFILRQGFKRIHVFPAVITAALVDAALIAVGVLGFGYRIEQNPALIQWVTWGGVAFLAAFGLKSLLSAFRPSHMDADDAQECSARAWRQGNRGDHPWHQRTEPARVS